VRDDADGCNCTRIFDCCLIVNRQHGLRADDVPLTYRKIGANAYGEEITGKFSDEIDLNHVVTELTAFLEAAVRECRPQYLRSEFTKNSGRHLKFEEIGLPLSNDGQNVDMLLCGVHVEKA
jgi:hypothetical protein